MPSDSAPPFVEEFPHGSEAYHDACALRHTFLRLPLGLQLTAADKADDFAQLHFGLFTQAGRKKNRLLIGGCICKPLEDAKAKTIQFRQVVIDEAWRSQGLGHQLMRETEELLAEKGFAQFILYARDEAVPFYERCGYQQTGETVELIGLPHHRMEK